MKLPTFVLFVLLASVQFLHAAVPLTLEEALSTALKSHPQVIEARENLNGAAARTRRASSAYYPQVGIAADWNKGRSYITALQNTKTTEIASGTLYMKQTIHDFGRTAGAVEAASRNKDAADDDLAITGLDVALRVKSAFYLLLAAEKQAVAVRETVAARADIHRQALEFFREGIRAKVDVASAEAELYTARTALIGAENSVEIAKIELASAMGIASLEDRPLVDTAPDLPPPLPERSLAQLEALQNRLELKRLANLKMAANANLKTARGSYLPILSGTASAGYADRDFPPAGNVWGVGLNLTVPLFSGFASVGEVREAVAVVKAVDARQDNLKLQIIKQVDSAWLDGNEAAARLFSTGKELEAADEHKLLAVGRYQEGVGSIIEVTAAQTRALESRTANIKARYDCFITRALLDRAIGKE